MDQQEVWKDIRGFEGQYQVSNLGQVKQLSYDRIIYNQYGEYSISVPERILKIGCGPTLSVTLKNKQHYVDRLVYSNFNDVPYSNIVKIIHLDGDKFNNNLDNLSPILNTEFSDDNWRTCPHYPDYEVSYEGHVRVKDHYSYYSFMGGEPCTHHYNAKVLEPSRTDDGYLYVTIRTGLNSSKSQSIHRLVAMTWLSDWDSNLTVNHKDGNKDNNCVENLEMMTQAENSYHYATAACFEQSRKERSAKLSKAFKGRVFTEE